MKKVYTAVYNFVGESPMNYFFRNASICTGNLTTLGQFMNDFRKNLLADINDCIDTPSTPIPYTTEVVIVISIYDLNTNRTKFLQLKKKNIFRMRDILEKVLARK